MNPSRPFILRPVATSLLMLAVLLTGVLAWRMLPISALPQVDYPIIQVTTLYPGASPEVTTSSITAPLERQFGQMPGLKQMSSSSSGGASVITLTFELDLPLDVAEQQVQAGINAATTVLPTDLPAPPVYSKVNPADAPIVTLAILSDSLPLTQVVDLVDTRLARRLSQVQGVGLVSMGGGQRPAVRVQADPGALAAKGLNLDDLRTAIGNANVNQPKGGFDGPRRASTIDANDQLRSASEYRHIIVAWRAGAPVRLGDVATVVEGPENARLAAWAGAARTGPGAAGQTEPGGAQAQAAPPVLWPAIVLNVQRQPGANVIDTVDRIRALLPQLQATLPAAVRVELLADRTTTIRASVRDVQRELLVSVALVVAVIWVFLRRASATLIPAVAVPLSLIGTFGVMYLAGFSLNNLSLMALTIAAGFVVDDAIVMIENVSRHVEAGEPPLQAALAGAREIGFTIVSLTVSLIAVLIPLLFMGDVTGRLFREFAITLAVAILISAAVSLTLTPMMSARLLRHRPADREGPVARRLAAGFDALTRAYDRALTRVLEHQPATLMVALATLIVTVLLYLWIPKGFFPVQDTGAALGITEAPQTISFAAMAERQQALARALLQDPAVDSVAAFIGVDGVNPTLNSGRLQIAFTPRAARDADLPTLLARLQSRAAQVEGIRLYLQPLQDLTIEDRVSRTRFQFTLQVLDPDMLAGTVNRVLDRLRREPLLVGVASDLQDQGLQAYVEIDRDAAGRLGITTAQIDNLLYSAFGQRLVSTVFTQANLYRVVLEVAPDFAEGPQALKRLHLITPTGVRVPLAAVARIVERPAALVVNHLGQFPSATVSFDVAEGASLGDAVRAIRAALDEVELPASAKLAFQGAALAFQSSLSDTLWLVLAAVVTMYIVLGVLYESYVHPVTILSTLPSATVGALLALGLAGRELDLIAVLGIVLLIGIVKKNAIMMIDFALAAQRTQGRGAREAIHEACLLRLRPILMTTMAAILGALPLVLGQGEGSELRQPLGIAMVGGLVASQLLTLFTTPVIYLGFDRLARRRPASGA